MDNTMDNQQVTLTNLAWLAGIWDGEGTFSIYEHNGFYSGRLTLSNTSEEMIYEIVRILDSYEIYGHIFKETKSRKPNHKKAYHLTFNKMESVKKACELMIPYLIVKKARAQLVKRFVESRLKYKKDIIRSEETGRIISVVKKDYTEEEKSLYDQLKALNKVGI